MTWTAVKTWANGEPVGAYDLLSEVNGHTDHLNYGAGAIRAMLWHDEAYIVAGNALTRVVNSSQYYGTYSYQSAAALNDQWTQSFTLGPGVYTVELYGYGTTNGGTLTVEIDGYEAGSAEFYRAGATFNIQAGVVSLYVRERHRCLLTGTVTGKSGSSSGYAVYLTYIVITSYEGYIKGDN